MTNACQMLILRLVDVSRRSKIVVGGSTSLRMFMEEEHVFDEHKTALDLFDQCLFWRARELLSRTRTPCAAPAKNPLSTRGTKKPLNP